MSKLKIFVGTDTSQKLAVKVLEHSIKKHTKADVEVVVMCDLPLPTPRSIANQQRTGFSFSRFCIPQFMNYQGKAIYLDADMLVFSDIMELFNWPMGEHYILIQKQLSAKKRIRQCSVMVIDCEKCNWDIDKIIDDLNNGKYNYKQLMHEMCILDDAHVGEVLPFAWNSLEHYDKNTQLIHYTDMNTQPWVSSFNKNADVWFSAVLEMLRDGSIKDDEIRAEINAGYFRPSLILDIYHFEKVPSFLRPLWNILMKTVDLFKGYTPHRKVVARVTQMKKEMAVKS